MCITVKSKEPRIATTDIEVVKYLYHRNGNEYVTPYRNFEIHTACTMVPDSDPNFYSRDIDRYDINGGVIHACMMPEGYYDGSPYRAIIPKGAKYWVGVEANSICASKLIVTGELIDKTVPRSLDKTLAWIFYAEAPCNKKGVRVGDIYVDGEFINPAQAKANQTLMVVGFNGEEPLIADLDNLKSSQAWDTDWNSNIDGYHAQEEALEDFNGWKHTQAFKKAISRDLRYKFEALNTVCSISENHYLPAFAEMKEFLTNVLYVYAALTMKEVPISEFYHSYWFWTSTEYSQRHSWGINLCSCGLRQGWGCKCSHGSFVPFFALNLK